MDRRRGRDRERRVVARPRERPTAAFFVNRRERSEPGSLSQRFGRGTGEQEATPVAARVQFQDAKHQAGRFAAVEGAQGVVGFERDDRFLDDPPQHPRRPRFHLREMAHVVRGVDRTADVVHAALDTRVAAE